MRGMQSVEYTVILMVTVALSVYMITTASSMLDKNKRWGNDTVSFMDSKFAGLVGNATTNVSMEYANSSLAQVSIQLDSSYSINKTATAKISIINPSQQPMYVDEVLVEVRDPLNATVEVTPSRVSGLSFTYAYIFDVSFVQRMKGQY